MKRVLAVDDDPGVLQTFTDALTAKGYEVVATDQVDGVIPLLRSQRFDLVMLDLQMPRRDGFDLYGEFAPSHDVPVLFISGFARLFSPVSPAFAGLWIEQFSHGRTDILYKPFAITELFEKVEALIGSSEEMTNGIRPES
ncbi:MAG TPA: response regulator [Verrucomicrobiae bacterium]|nr:response regulator [Verrucomicrobiae bacterium]